MLTDEWLIEHKDILNDLVDTADTMGDAGPVLGTLVVISLSEEDYETFSQAPKTGDQEGFLRVLQAAQARFQRLGIAADEPATL